MLKDVVYKAISAAGYCLTPEMYFKDLELSCHLRQLFTHLNISCVFDVGANEGQFRNFLRRRCGYEGLIISFEPVRSVFEVIRARAQNDARWIVNHCALGARDGKLQINVMQDTHFNSFLAPQSPEIDHPQIAAKNIVVRQEEVDVLTLESALKNVRQKRTVGNVYLKMDTQGFDLEIMRGAGSALESVCALQTEVSVKPLYEGMATFTKAIGELGRYGFDITGLFPVERDRLLRVIEFDCVAIKSPIAHSVSP